MGGRGTFAAGVNAGFTYETVGKIEDIKVLKGLNGRHGLPEESHSSNAYIKLDHNGNFYEMRIYDKSHFLIYEFAYHPEPNIDKSRRPVLHYHLYDRKFGRTSAAKATKAMKKHFSKYLKGVSS